VSYFQHDYKRFVSWNASIWILNFTYIIIRWWCWVGFYVTLLC